MEYHEEQAKVATVLAYDGKINDAEAYTLAAHYLTTGLAVIDCEGVINFRSTDLVEPERIREMLESLRTGSKVSEFNRRKRRRRPKAPGATSYLHIDCTPAQKAAYVRAAGRKGLVAWALAALDDAAK